MRMVWLFVILLVLGGAGSVRATEGLDQLSQFLEANGVLVDRTQALHGATEGLLKAIDPEARICSPEEAAAWRAQWAGHPGESEGGLTQTVAAVELWPEDIAYLKLRGLYAGSGEEVMAHLRALAGRPGVILDLRGTDGSDLQAAIGLASPYYCPGEALLALEDNRGLALATNNAIASPPVRTSIMVLTDRSTCCAAETLAALWHGRPGVMLIGSATHGDTRVRDILTLPDGTLLYVATRRVVPLQGGGYEGTGVQPDVVVAASNADPAWVEEAPANGKPLSAKAVMDRDLMRRVDGDVVLRRATDILLGLRALNGYGER